MGDLQFWTADLTLPVAASGGDAGVNVEVK